jgi:hypothetical protein
MRCTFWLDSTTEWWLWKRGRGPFACEGEFVCGSCATGFGGCSPRLPKSPCVVYEAPDGRGSGRVRLFATLSVRSLEVGKAGLAMRVLLGSCDELNQRALQMQTQLDNGMFSSGACGRCSAECVCLSCKAVAGKAEPAAFLTSHAKLVFS